MKPGHRLLLWEKCAELQDVPVHGTFGVNKRCAGQLFRERTMGKVIERILQVFGKKEEPDSTGEVLLDFLSKKPGTEERSAVVEEVDFLKDLRT